LLEHVPIPSVSQVLSGELSDVEETIAAGANLNQHCCGKIARTDLVRVCVETDSEYLAEICSQTDSSRGGELIPG